MNRKLLSLYGLKWNPFAPNVPTEALHVSAAVESFCWRVGQLSGEGGFALVTGNPGTGKSVALRILADRLLAQRDVKVGVLSRPQAGLHDFYREMGDLFGVELRPPTTAGPAPSSCAAAGRPTSTPLCCAPSCSSTRPRRPPRRC